MGALYSVTAATLAALPYPGGKSAARRGGVNEWIRGLLPGNTHAYIEVFGGMLGVLLARDPVPSETANDADMSIVNWWRVVRDPARCAELAAMLELTPASRMEHRAAVTQDEQTHAKTTCLPPDDPDQPAVGDVQWAWAWTVAIASSVGGDINGAGWAWEHDDSRGRPRLKRVPGMIRPLAERLQDVQLECGDAVEYLNRLANRAGQSSLIYADPPYEAIPEQRFYRCAVDMDSLDDALLRQQALVAVSGYPGEHAPLEDAGWLRHEKLTSTTISSGRPHDERVECLWTNYDPGLFGDPRLF